MIMNNREEPNKSREISSEKLFILSVTSAAVYLLLSFLIFRFIHDSSLVQVFVHGYSIPGQLLYGLAAGGIAAGIIGFIIKRPLVSRVLRDFQIVDLLMNIRLTLFDRIQLSIFAGVGEELLFRGAIQPLLGIWITSLLFVGIHGYFKFKTTGHVLFGFMMFGLSVGLGYLFEWIGLIAAMVAHAVYDLIMLKLVQNEHQ